MEPSVSQINTGNASVRDLWFIHIGHCGEGATCKFPDDPNTYIKRGEEWEIQEEISLKQSD